MISVKSIRSRGCWHLAFCLITATFSSGSYSFENLFSDVRTNDIGSGFGEGVERATASESAGVEAVEFSEFVPNSITRTITVPDGTHADIHIFAKDCCTRDDVVNIRVGRCPVATVDSRGGARGTHKGELHKISVGPGEHTITYTLNSDDVGPSGWDISAEVMPGTGQHLCFDQDPSVIDAIRGVPGCGFQLTTTQLKTYNDDVGNRIDIRCERFNIFGEYQMVLTPANGSGFSSGPLLIGRCIYQAGCNNAAIFHTGDFAPRNGVPDCFLSTKWESVDEQYPFPDVDDDRDGKVDSVVYKYDFITGTLNFKNYEVNSPAVVASEFTGPPSAFDVPGNPPINSIDVSNARMLNTEFKPCDLDKNSVCDELDHAAFRGADGAVAGDLNFFAAADFDGDGVVNDVDARYLGFSGPVSESRLTPLFKSVYHDRRRARTIMRISILNESNSRIRTTNARLVFKDVSDPFAMLMRPDGETPDEGFPYIDLGPLDLPEAGESKMIIVAFSNPLLRRFQVNAEIRVSVFDN